MTNFIIGVALDGPLEEQITAARTLDAAGIDFATLSDTNRLDPLTTLSFIAPRTRQIGLVPTVPTTHNEPFHIATATATLDYTGEGRAGWSAEPSLGQREARAIGRRPAPEREPAWRETGEIIDTVRALWDSWEPGAEIRDARSGRFLDRDKVHYVEAELTDSTGTSYTIKGPSIVPNPPQGNPPVFVFVTDDESRRIAIEFADVIIVPVSANHDAVDVVAKLRAEASSQVILPSFKIPEPADRQWIRETIQPLVKAGIDGVHLRPGSLLHDVQVLTSEISDSAGRYGHHSAKASLRQRLGIAPAVNRFAVQRA